VLRHVLAACPPDVLITVPRSACRTLDFHKAEQMIALGRRLAVDALDDLAGGRQQTGGVVSRWSS
jgi:NTE family protein